jgi:hypothetical protein
MNKEVKMSKKDIKKFNYIWLCILKVCAGLSFMSAIIVADNIKINFPNGFKIVIAVAGFLMMTIISVDEIRTKE